uniref:ubiquitinyl hydrolase 1 n=1 Tax=Oryza meridionalis TaxID=40149 RepID=A0A0E0DJA1_9ORYZ
MRRKPAASEGWGSDADPDSGSSGNGGGGGGGGSRGGDSPPSSPSTPSSPSPQPLLPTLPSPQAFVEAYTGYEDQGAWDPDSLSLELGLATLRELDYIRYQEAQEDWRKSDDNKSDSCKQKDKEQGAWDLHSMSLELELAPFQELEWIRYQEAQEDWRKSDDNKSDSCKQKDKEQGAWDLHSMSLELELAPFQELEWIRYQEAQEDWRRSYDNKSDSCKLRDKATSDDRSKSGDNKYDSCKTRDKKPIMDLADEFENNTIKKKITLLSKKYDFFRPVDRDGSCFYRAFIFSYMERIVAMQDDLERIIEVSRIGERVGKYKQAYARFGSFGIPQEEFLKALSAFEQLINLIEKGFVTEIEICTHEDQYKDFLLTADCASVFEFCQVEVRPENAEASQQQMKALAEALGIPVLVENLDTTSKENETPELNQHFIYPRPESEEGTMLGPLNLHEIVSPESSGYHAARGELQNQPGTSGSSTNSSTEALGLQSIGTSSTPNERDGNGDMTINDLSPAERRRLATLLYRPGHYDILCPK